MKRAICLLLLLLLTVCVFSQHTIIRKNGRIIKVQEIEVMKAGVFYVEFGKDDLQYLKKRKIADIYYYYQSSSHHHENRQMCEVKLPERQLFVVCKDVKIVTTWYDAVVKCPNGYRLPTVKELKYMRKVHKMIALDNNNTYWSSNAKKHTAYSVSIKDGDKAKYFKYQPCKVRYVRDY
jgi:hypothetical protein